MADPSYNFMAKAMAYVGKEIFSPAVDAVPYQAAQKDAFTPFLLEEILGTNLQSADLLTILRDYVAELELNRTLDEICVSVFKRHPPPASSSEAAMREFLHHYISAKLNGASNDKGIDSFFQVQDLQVYTFREEMEKYAIDRGLIPSTASDDSELPTFYLLYPMLRQAASDKMDSEVQRALEAYPCDSGDGRYDAIRICHCFRFVWKYISERGDCNLSRKLLNALREKMGRKSILDIEMSLKNFINSYGQLNNTVALPSLNDWEVPAP